MKARFALITLWSLHRPHQTYRCLSGPPLLRVSSHDKGICDMGDAKASFWQCTGAYPPELWETLELLCLALRFAGAWLPTAVPCRSCFSCQQGGMWRADYSDSVPVHYFKLNSCDFFFSSGESIPLVSVLKNENFPSHLIIQTQQPRNISNCHLYFTKHFVFNIF